MKKIMSVLLIGMIIISNCIFVYANVLDDDIIQPKSGGSKKLSVSLIMQKEKSWCGPACGEMVLRYFNKNISQTTLANENNMGTDIIDGQGGTYVYKVSETLNKYLGSGTYSYKGLWDTSFYQEVIRSIDNGKPVICQVNTRELPHYNNVARDHYVVVCGYNWGQGSGGGINNVTFNDPNYEPEYYGQYICRADEMIDAIRAKASYYISLS